MVGLVAMNDPLSHVEMSELMMDRQVQHLLKMKFANFPNRSEIEAQVE